VTGLLISPLSWNDHWVWIVPVFVWLASVAYRLHRSMPVTAGAVPSLAVLPFLMWPQPLGPPGDVVPASILSPARHMWEDEGSRNPVVALAGAAYVLVGLFLLVAGGVALRRYQCDAAVDEVDGVGELDASADTRSLQHVL
jgi:alpha-1,2-mannosyltransferase